MKDEFTNVFSLIGTCLVLNSCSGIEETVKMDMVFIGIFVLGVVLFVILVIILQKYSRRDSEIVMKKYKNWVDTFLSGNRK